MLFLIENIESEHIEKRERFGDARAENERKAGIFYAARRYNKKKDDGYPYFHKLLGDSRGGIFIYAANGGKISREYI